MSFEIVAKNSTESVSSNLTPWVKSVLNQQVLSQVGRLELFNQLWRSQTTQCQVISTRAEIPMKKPQGCEEPSGKAENGARISK